MSESHRLSKSRYTAGLQCHKQLWWRVHEPDAPELVPGSGQQQIFDTGNRVGEVARGHVPGGLLIDLPHTDITGKIAATERAIAENALAIYEASIVGGDVFVAVDILARESAGWRVIEVKSTTDRKRQHIPDVAVQVYAAREAGLVITGADVMVLNRACAFPDLSNLFTRHDVTEEVEALLSAIPAEVHAQRTMLEGALPDVASGSHCTKPYECPFVQRCHSPVPPHHVSTLYKSWKLVPALEAQGHTMIHSLPAGLDLNPQAERQRRAVQSGRLVVEGDLAASLAAFRSPLVFLDFETVQFAIPIWDGCHPYDQIPAQFSSHRERPDGGLDHHAWLPTAAGDPRVEMARRVIDACAGAGSVVAYNAGFEANCLELLAKAVPECADDLRAIAVRLVDLLPVVREHVYHPEFGGSFGLKAVLPALVPELSYGDLEIADGGTASHVLRCVVLGDPSPRGTDTTRDREALLRYCERDTLAMVRVWERVRELAREARPA